jgi:hypothetical protein
MTATSLIERKDRRENRPATNRNGTSLFYYLNRGDDPFSKQLIEPLPETQTLQTYKSHNHS